MTSPAERRASPAAERAENRQRYWLVTLAASVVLGAVVTGVTFAVDRSGLGLVGFVVVPVAVARIVAQRRRIASNARNPGNWEARIPGDDAAELWPGAWRRRLWSNFVVAGVSVKGGILTITPPEGYVQLTLAMTQVEVERISTAFAVSVFGTPIPLFTRAYVFRLALHGPDQTTRMLLDERDSFRAALTGGGGGATE